MSSPAQPKIYKGLDGVVADKTAVSTVGKHEAGLTYRGYAIEDLALKCSFEQVAHLLIRGDFPPDLSTYKKKMASYRHLSNDLKKLLELIPKSAHPMDVQRTVCSYLGNLAMTTDPSKSKEPSIEDCCEKIMSCLPSALCYWHHFSQHGKRITVNVDGKDGMAAAFLKMLHQKEPDALHTRIIDAAFTLYAEHDFNASTFTARTIASTYTADSIDTFSCITGAIGALRGPLHGGANEAVMHYLNEFKSVDDGLTKIKEKISKKQLVMGFGHRIYKNGDPRNAVFKKIIIGFG